MLNFTSNQDSSELKEIARSMRKFAESQFSSKCETNYRREDFDAASKLGLCGMSLPEELGGSAFSQKEIATAVFELSRAELGPAVYLSVHLMVSGLIHRSCADGRLAELLTELASGKKLAAFCLTESQAGSDAAALKTKAQKHENTYRIDGEKVYITSGGVADVYLVFARTNEDKTKGISAFVVEKDNPGISFGKPEKKLGCHGAPISTVTFNNCTVPESARIGEEGAGYKIALSGLNGGRVNIAAAACGLASRSLEIAHNYCKERKQFGNSLAEFQGIQFMVADMLTQLRAAVLLTRDAAEELDFNPKLNTKASIAKCFATDAAMKITTDGVQLLGGAGYLEDYTVERLMRDAKMLQIVEGTNQIQRILIARALFQDN